MNGTRLVVDVPADLLVRNDAAVDGRLPLVVGCPACRVPEAHGWLGRGRWVVEHVHGGGWTVRPALAGAAR